MFKKIMAAGLISTMTLVGCTQDKKAKTNTVVVSASAQMDAEELAQAGEQLISPTTFHLADRIFQQVLEKDPRNQKAKLYRAALKPFIVYKGALARVRPAMIKHGKESDYAKTVKNLRQSPLKNWLLNGPEDIETAAQFQELEVKSRLAMEEFRRFLKANPNLDLTIYLNEFVHANLINERRSRDCYVIEDSPDNLQVHCDESEIAQRKMNSADVVMLQQMVAGWILYQGVLDSYSWNGYETVTNQLQEITDKVKTHELDQKVAAERRMALLTNLPEFGKLRKDHVFSSLKEIGADLKAAMEWAVKYQTELCPLGSKGGQFNRKGYVMEQGWCTADDDGSDVSITKMIAFLKEGLTGDGVTTLDDGKNTPIKPFVYATNPIQDLRSIKPTAFDACGEATAYADLSFGGLMPTAPAIVPETCTPRINGAE